MRGLDRWLTCVAATWLAAVATARAASFDCAKAASPMERAICANPKLSAADEALAKLYRADLDQLSPDGRTALRDSQRSWLAYAVTRCQPSAAPLEPNRWRSIVSPTNTLVQACLEDTYRDRDSRLKQAVVRLADKTFLSTTMYRVRKPLPQDQDDDVPKGPPYDIEWALTNLQIDDPKSASARLWNADITTQFQDAVATPSSILGDADFERGDMDVHVEVHIIAASPTLISTRVWSSGYEHGMAHPQSESHGSIWSLKLGRPLGPADVFTANFDLKETLTRLVFKHLPPDWRTTKAQEALPYTISEISSWSLTPDGLEITFDPYSVAGYIPPQPITVSWSELKPYLKPQLPFDPAAIQLAPQ